MSEYEITDLIASTRPLRQLTIPPIEEEEGREVLRKHGCSIEEDERLQQCIIFFPEGTTKTEIFLRLIHPRYRITLPDGYELRETYDRYQGMSILSYPSEPPKREM
jgi:hypothetical protein